MTISQREIRRQQDKALSDFVSAVFDDDGNPSPSDDMENTLRALVRKFGFDLIQFEDRQLRDDSSLKAITRAIRKLKRMEQRITIKSISRIVRMNYTRCRDLMVTYGLYDVEARKVVNYFDDWKELGRMPLED